MSLAYSSNNRSFSDSYYEDTIRVFRVKTRIIAVALRPMWRLNWVKLISGRRAYVIPGFDEVSR